MPNTAAVLRGMLETMLGKPRASMPKPCSACSIAPRIHPSPKQRSEPELASNRQDLPYLQPGVAYYSPNRSSTVFASGPDRRRRQADEDGSFVDARRPAVPIYFPITFRSASLILSCQPGPAS